MRNIIALFSIRNPPGMPEDGWRQAREWAIWEVAPGRYSLANETHLCFIHSFPEDATRDDMLHYVYGMVYHTLRILDGSLFKRRFYVACVLSCILFPLFWILVAYYSLKEKCR